MKVLITGSRGQLGHHLKKIYPKGTIIFAPTREDLDLSNIDEAKKQIKEINPDCIINCAAYTNVDKAEIDQNIALKINAELPKMLAEVLIENGGNLLHLSTDFVFDGNENKPYKVNHDRNPLNFYGESKMQGEIAIEEKLKEFKMATILRTSWVISPIGRNFLLTMIKLFKEKKVIKVVSDQIGCPTSAHNLAKVCWNIVKVKSNRNLTEKLPLYMHYSDAGVASWYDLAVCIQDLLNDINLFKNETEIIPIKTCEFNSKTKRPCYSVLDSDQTMKLLKLKPIHWKKGLLEIIRKIKV